MLTDEQVDTMDYSQEDVRRLVAAARERDGLERRVKALEHYHLSDAGHGAMLRLYREAIDDPHSHGVDEWRSMLGDAVLDIETLIAGRVAAEKERDELRAHLDAVLRGAKDTADALADCERCEATAEASGRMVERRDVVAWLRDIALSENPRVPFRTGDPNTTDTGALCCAAILIERGEHAAGKDGG